MEFPTSADADRTALHETPAAKWRSSPPIKEQFVGTWKLVSWKIEQVDGELIDSPLGADALGGSCIALKDTCVLHSCAPIAQNSLPTI